MHPVKSDIGANSAQFSAYLTASCSACRSGSIEAAESPSAAAAAFSCVDDDAGESSVTPPLALPADAAEVTVTAIPAELVDEATAVSIAAK